MSDSSDDVSLYNAPTVEYLVRHQIVRNRTIEKLLEEMIDCIFDPKCHRRIGIHSAMKRVLDAAYLELGFEDPALYTKDRVDFAKGTKNALLF